MKMFSLLLVSLSIVVISIAGCGGNKKFGQEITVRELTQIKEILSHPNKYFNKNVRIEGKIIQECPAGGWFYLQDQAATIFVNLHPSGFAIPQRVDKNVIVQGQVKIKDQGAEIIGKGVELR